MDRVDRSIGTLRSGDRQQWFLRAQPRTARASGMASRQWHLNRFQYHILRSILRCKILFCLCSGHRNGILRIIEASTVTWYVEKGKTSIGRLWPSKIV